MNHPRIILAGGSGFLGHVLADFFAARGHEIIILTRTPHLRDGSIRKAGLIREAGWGGETIGPWTRELDGATALVNLAGVSVNCRYHARNRRSILDSRINSTRVLGEALARCENPPAVWINSSTATIYKHTFGPAWDEAGEIGGCAEAKDIFSVHVASEWERVFNEATAPRTRKVALRSAMVLGQAKNSVLPNLLRLARVGLGGHMAGGHQFVSWIHQEDFCRAVEWIIEHKNLSGPVNLAAPNPVTNAELMAAVRKVINAPFGLPAPRWLLEIGAMFMRTETELIIKSRRVVPGKLLTSGFVFRHPQLLPAIDQLVNQEKRETDRFKPH
ncbi:MAG TPA: TIGR01777 family oxidoreductase [Candidatus Nitrosotalea sp.]|nr:TIGR01777 family oxidoreductase [Candidatus Nitrosotalea sp.]